MRRSPLHSFRIKPVVMVAALGAMAMSGCATMTSDNSPAKKGVRGDDCVFFSSVYDWQGLDDTTLVLWAPGRRDAYEVELSMPLVGLRNAYSLGFIDGTQDGRLCGFGRDAVTMGDDSIPSKSSIRSITKLTPEALQGLEEKYKTKLTRDSKRKSAPKSPDRESAK